MTVDAFKRPQDVEAWTVLARRPDGSIEQARPHHRRIVLGAVALAECRYRDDDALDDDWYDDLLKEVRELTHV